MTSQRSIILRFEVLSSSCLSFVFRVAPSSCWGVVIGRTNVCGRFPHHSSRSRVSEDAWKGTRDGSTCAGGRRHQAFLSLEGVKRPRKPLSHIDARDAAYSITCDSSTRGSSRTEFRTLRCTSLREPHGPIDLRKESGVGTYATATSPQNNILGGARIFPCRAPRKRTIMGACHYPRTPIV